VLAVVVFQQQQPVALFRVGNNVMTADHPIRMDTKDGLQRWTVAGRVRQKYSELVSQVVNFLILGGGSFQLGDGTVTASLVPRAGDSMQYDLPSVFGTTGPLLWGPGRECTLQGSSGVGTGRFEVSGSSTTLGASDGINIDTSGMRQCVEFSVPRAETRAMPSEIRAPEYPTGAHSKSRGLQQVSPTVSPHSLKVTLTFDEHLEI